MKKQKLLTLLAVTMTIILAAGSASAEVIFYDSFESPVVTARTKTTVAGPDGLLPGWERDETVGNKNRCGAYPSSTGDFTTPFGSQAAWIWGGVPGPVLLTTTTETGITDVLTAGTTYTLTFNVSTESLPATQNYEVYLLAGPTVLGSAIGTVTTDDMSQTDSIVFTAPFGHPGLGETIRIKLTKGEGGSHYTKEALYDNVKLIAEIDPMDAYPAFGVTVPSDDVDLMWTNLDANTPGGPVWIDVLFGTDPEDLQPITGFIKVTGVDTAPVTLPGPGVYYWQIISYLHGDPATEPYGGPGEPNSVASQVYDFNNDAPIAAVGLDAPHPITWLGEPVGIVVDVNDDDRSALDYTWTYLPDVSADPNSNITVTITHDLADPTVAVIEVTNTDPNDLLFNIEVTLTVSDETNPAVTSNTVTIDVYDTACLAARIGDDRAKDNLGDFDGNCKTGLEDLAAIAAAWLTDLRLETPIRKP